MALEVDRAVEKQSSVRKKAEDGSVGDLMFKYRTPDSYTYFTQSRSESTHAAEVFFRLL